MLETEQFVEMCMKLMNHSHHTIRNQTLILFAEKTSLASKDSISMYAVMLPKLIELFGLSDNDESRQHTLLCLSVMIKVFARENLSRFTSLFQLAASVISQPDLNVNVRISCVSMVSLLM